jgi:transcriptional regulator with GAF, ATPase, and Fis domain
MASIPGNGAEAPVAVTPAADAGEGSLALQSLERRHIIDVLRKTRGVIEGPQGAARLLKLKPSTARFRVRKLGISRSDYE